MARFEREAKVLASLNHPNIATLYELESVASGTETKTGTETVFLVMELVDGEDLSQRIERGAIPVDEAIPIALQIAEALEAAHEQGIVHRDLKPANIKIDRNGGVKVLDFGLAKTWESNAGESSLSLSPTVTHATAAGVILGTAAYMSPEQARGQTVDRRADIWSFGVVFLEMLTGRKLFEGETVSDVLASVLKEKPDLDALPGSTPPLIRRVLDRCLQKEPRNRLQWIGDARLELAEVQPAGSEAYGTAATGTDPRSRVREWAAWLVAAIALAAAGIHWLRPAPTPDAMLTRFAISVGEDQQASFVGLPIVGLSPDGRTLAFMATNLELGLDMIYVRRLSEDHVWPLAGTEGGSNPFFSPDGTHIAFFAEGKLKKIPVDGGSVVTLADTPNSRGGVWLPDNTILFSPEYAAGLWRVSASGGKPEIFVDIDPDKGERTYRFPDVHPDGQHVLFTVGSVDSPNSYEDALIVSYSLSSGERTVLVDGANMARFVGKDKLVYWKSGKLFVILLDLKRGVTLGEPVAVIDDVGGDPSSGAGYFAISKSGTIAWVNGEVTEANSLLTIVGPDDRKERVPLDPRGFHQPRMSPDGTKIAVTVGRGQYGVDGDVWLYDLATGAFNRFTFDGNSTYPLWTPDGRGIAYLDYSDESGISVKPADGSGVAESLTPPDRSPVFPESFSPDGRTLAYTRIGATSDIYLITSGGEARLFEKDASGPVFSPDGRWIAYFSPGSGSGSTRVYVRSVEGEGKWQVSPEIGSYPRWSGDGNQLYYVQIDVPNRPLMVVDVAEGDIFRVGPSRVVVEDLGGRFVTAVAPAVNWDASRADDRFIFVEIDRDDWATTQVELAINWAQNLDLDSQ
jgi:serine/threonine-protein kinase